MRSPRQGPSLGAALALALVAASSARAQRAVRYDVEATLDTDGRVEGIWTLHAAVTEETRALRLWVYADRIAARPSALDEQTGRWLFPREVDLREVAVSEVELDGAAVEGRWERAPPGSDRGRDFAGGDLLVPVPRGAAREVTLRLRFAYRLPERFGRLGRVGRRLSLTGPWYPLLVDDDVYAHDALHRVRLRARSGLDVLAGAGRRDGVLRSRGPYVPLVAAPTLHQRTLEVQGRLLRVTSHRPLYTPPDRRTPGAGALRDVVRVDVVARIADVLADVLTTMEAVGVPVRDGAFDVVLVPSRTELAADAPSLLLLSDRAFEIFPLRDVRAFHERALRRALFRYLLDPAMRRVEPPEDRAWATDLRAVLLGNLDDVRQAGDVLSAEDLIGWAGFHPAIDQLLYAPQVAFVDAYFGSTLEPDRFRDAPERARRAVVRGRYVLENARDVLDEDTFRSWSRAVLSGQPAREALVAVSPELAARLDGWLRAAASPVNYRLGAIRSEREGEVVRHVVEVHRDGADRPEPVVVEVTDEEGHVVRETWDAPGARGEVVLETPGDRAQVRIDPERRLPQSAEVADGHPLRDDQEHTAWRPPVFQGLTLSYNATEQRLVGLLDFVMRRRFDLDNRIGGRLFTNARSTGGFVRYSRGVGRKRDTNNRVGSIGGGLGLDHLRSGFASDVGGWRVSGFVAGTYNSLRYFLDPRQGALVSGSVRASMTFRDDGTVGYTVSPSLRGNATVPLGLRGALVLVGGGSAVIGDALPSQRPGLGGRFLLRGYQTDEVVGRAALFGAVEARFTPTVLSDLHLNALHLAWVREIQLAVFVASGVVFDADDGRDVAPGLEVGGGVRFHFEYAGVQPAVLVLDVSRPLLRTEEATASRPPIGFLLAFEQYF